MEFNLLFSSAGRRVALLRLFRAALRELDVAGRIIAVDNDCSAPALFEADTGLLVPPVEAESYVESLLEICTAHKVTLLVPLIDTELLLLSQHRESFRRVGTEVLISSPETVEICSDKRLTEAFFTRHGVSTPRSYQFQSAEIGFPVIIKPACGSGSTGVMLVNSQQELEFFYQQLVEPVIQEYVDGSEYTIDVLVDLGGKVLCVVPRRRLATRAGETSKGRTVKDAELMAACRTVVETLPGAFGCLTVQCFRGPDGRLYFIEINPRFGGGFPLAARAGADFPRWIIEMLLGKIPTGFDQWQDGLTMLRYDDAIFVDSLKRT